MGSQIGQLGGMIAQIVVKMPIAFRFRAYATIGESHR